MVIVCMKCKMVMGEKEPLEDKSMTHGCCPECVKEYDRMLEELDKRDAAIAAACPNIKRRF